MGEALGSIFTQTRPADEVILVDDGSTDGGGESLGRWRDKIHLILQENRGVSAALNRGLRAATGDAIAFLDADDLWAEDKLRRQSALLDAEPAIDGVFGYIRQFASPGTMLKFDIPEAPQPGICAATLLVRNSAFEHFGWFDEGRRTAGFVPWYSRAAALGLRTRMMSDLLAYRRVHGQNTGIVRRDDLQEDSLLALKQALDIRRKRASTGGAGA